MKKHLLGSLLALGIITPLFANAAPSGWVLGQPVSSSNWISNAGCASVINSSSCDYTGPSKALRLDYEYEFADEFWAGDRDRKLKNFCYEFKEPTNHGNYNQNLDGSGGENPSFSWTDELKNNIKEGVGYWVDKNTSMVILRANKIYQINAVPQTRSSNNLLVKYVVEYANDKAATTRYQHTECYPYEISRCGDGVVDKDWFRKDPSDPAEECDPAATEWKNRSDGKTCSSTCKIIEPAAPVCGSAYNNQTEYTTSSSHWLTSSSTNLCDEGGVVDFSYTPQTGGPRIYTWNCKNGSKKTDKLCTARQERCGDGVKNGEEDCDDGDKNGTNDSSCSKTCTTVGNAECGQKNKTKTYFTGGRQSTPWLTETSPQMCADGQIVGKPVMVGDHIEWTCSNQNGTQKTCKAYQEWCGDGVTNGDETCDGGELCDAECKIIQTDGCTKIYTGSFRIGDSHLFEDKFDAGWHDRYLYYKDVSFVENYGDHNNGTNPDFDWSKELKNNGMFLAANTVDFPGIKANSVYKFINKPTKRASNNIEIEYTIWYGNDKVSPAPDKRNLYKHKECAYYEISRCGDGVLDTKYGEECDPEIEPWKSNHRCDPVTCKEKDSLIGHLDIKKTLTGKLTVENTGEILTWEVKVTALSGDVDGFEIQDIIPFALKYIDYEVSSNPDKLTVNDPMGPTKTSTGNVYTWTTKGVLRSGHSLLLKVKTEVVLMPKTESDYRNVACVVKDNKTEDCDNDKPKQPSLRIKKYFLNADGSVTKDSKTVKIGDEIVYKIIFGNSGNAAATITSIKDFLPKNVKYVSSEIHIERNSNHSSGSQIGNEEFKGYKIVDGMYIDIYGGITLEPGDQGYIILTGKVLNENQDSTTNFACIYLNGERIDCDDVVHHIGMMCEKLEIPAGDLSSAGGSKEVTCKTTSGQIARTIEIECGNGTIITGSNVAFLKGTCTYPSGSRTYSLQCKVNGETADSCKGSVTVPGGGSPGSSCFIAGTMVTMCYGEPKPIEKVEIGDCVLGQNNYKNIVKGLDRPTLGDRNLWKINDKGDYFVSDEHPFMTTEGRKSFNPELSNLEIENAREAGMLKGGDYPIVSELEIGDMLITQDGEEKVRDLEFLDPAKKNPNTRLYNLVLDGNNTYYANGYLVHNKGSSGGSKDPKCEKVDVNKNSITCTSTSTTAYFRLTCDDKKYYSYDYKDGDTKDWDYTFKDTECKNAKQVKCEVSKNKNGGWNSSAKCIEEQTPSSEIPQGCFNVNAGNFSIEEGEILPFYWNMKNMDYFFKKINKDNYTEMNGDYRNAPSNYEALGDCTDDQEGKIAKDSMVCEFNIYDGDVYHKGVHNGIKDYDNPLYTIKGPCLSKTPAINTNDLIKARYKKMVEVYCSEVNPGDDCVFYFEEGKSSSAVLPTAVYYIKNFGSGATVHLNIGTSEGEWELDRKKESDKSFGEYKIELSRVKYLVCENKKWQQEDTSKKGSEAELNFKPCQNDFVLTNSYTVQKTPSGNLTASINELKKYRDYVGTITFDMLLNAIQSTDYKPNKDINRAMSGFINKYRKLAVKVDLNNSSFLQGTEVSKVPGKSIYFVDGNVTIKGGSSEITKPFTIVQTAGNTTINGNVSHNMMLLTNGNIIFQGNCDYDQNVKGIFYAAGNLVRTGVNKNNEISHNYWCANGGLHVKGVLIGNNFNNLMNKSRSNLNWWFQVNGDDNQIKNQRRKYIMDGASVVIEYSPSIFTKSTMPPGAEDFTTALSIYKQ